METNLTNQVETLTSLLPKLDISSQKFATSLIDSFKKHGHLSANQAPWIGKLIARASQVKVEPKNVGGFGGVVALLVKAKEKLKFPKIRLKMTNGVVIVLSLLGTGSKAAGSVNVSGEGKYPYAMWYGRVSPEGVWTASQKTPPAMLAELEALLVKLSANPARVAKDYGKLTGNCCFCGKSLYGEDGKSVAAGFGPICAEHYGLMDEWNTAVVKQGLKASAPVHAMVNSSLSVDELNKEIQADPVLKQQVQDFLVSSQTTGSIPAYPGGVGAKELFSVATVTDSEQAGLEDIGYVKQAPWKTGMINSGMEDVEMIPAVMPVKLAEKTKCYFCEQEKDPLVIKEGYPVCFDCVKEMEMA